MLRFNQCPDIPMITPWYRNLTLMQEICYGKWGISYMDFDLGSNTMDHSAGAFVSFGGEGEFHGTITIVGVLSAWE